MHVDSQQNYFTTSAKYSYKVFFFLNFKPEMYKLILKHRH